MPQSRKRQTGRRRGRSQGLYSPSQSQRRGPRSGTRIIALALVGALALAGAYLLLRGGGGGRSGEVTTASGLRYVDLVEGTGPTPQPGQRVSVHYTGTLESGVKFESSRDRNQPLEFTLGRGMVIKGWDEGIATMKVGGKRKLIVPAKLGYGPQGRPPSIPGNATLIFEIELLGIK